MWGIEWDPWSYGRCGEGEFHLPYRLLNSGRPVGSPLLQWLSYRSNWDQIQKQMRPSRSVKFCLPFKCWMFLSFHSRFYLLVVSQMSLRASARYVECMESTVRWSQDSFQLTFSNRGGQTYAPSTYETIYDKILTLKKTYSKYEFLFKFP